MLSTVERVLFLMRAPVTAEIPTDALSRLATVAREQELEPGHMLFTVADPADVLYIVLDGAVRIAGTEVETRLCGPGDCIGGLALLGGGPHAASASAVVTTSVLCVDRAELQDLLDEDGELARALFAGLLRAARVLSPGAIAA